MEHKRSGKGEVRCRNTTVQQASSQPNRSVQSQLKSMLGRLLPDATSSQAPDSASPPPQSWQVASQ